MKKTEKRNPESARGSVGLCLLLGLSLAGCGRGDRANVVQTKGSDTMVNVAQAWAEAYKQVAPEVKVEVSGGGSGTGIAALIRGTVEMATSSRDIKPKETAEAKRHTGRDLHEYTVGYDALAVFVHKENPLETISFEQLTEIFAENGTIAQWSALGVELPAGAGDAIVRVSRQSSSGTYEFFREHVLGNRDFKLGSRDMNGSKEVVELVARTPSAIGYSGMGYATPEVKMLKLAVKAGQPPIAPSVETALDKSYPLARAFHIYTLGEPQGAAKAYLDWILSPAGQRIVERSGYVPLPRPGGAD